MNTGVNNIPNYTTLLRQVKGRVALAQQRAIYVANVLGLRADGAYSDPQCGPINDYIS